MTDLGSKTTLRVLVILRGQLQANHSLPNGGGQVGLISAIFSYPIIMIYELMHQPPLVLPRRGDAGYF